MRFHFNANIEALDREIPVQIYIYICVCFNINIEALDGRIVYVFNFFKLELWFENKLCL